jgi:site-specific recombinase XerD
MREDLALRGMSAGTIVTYLGCARRFAEYFGRSPSRMGAAEIRAFLLHLVGRVHPNTFNVYVSALRFLYGVTLERPERDSKMPRMRVPMHLPTVLTRVEVEQILGALSSDKHRVVVMLAYGAGLGTFVASRGWHRPASDQRSN